MPNLIRILGDDNFSGCWWEYTETGGDGKVAIFPLNTGSTLHYLDSYKIAYQMKCKCRSYGSNNARLAIYKMSNPGDANLEMAVLIAQTEAQGINTSQQVRTFKFTNPILLAPGWYALAYQWQNANGFRICVNETPTGYRARSASDTYSDGFSDPFGSNTGGYNATGRAAQICVEGTNSLELNETLNLKGEITNPKFLYLNEILNFSDYLRSPRFQYCLESLTLGKWQQQGNFGEPVSSSAIENWEVYGGITKNSSGKITGLNVYIRVNSGAFGTFYGLIYKGPDATTASLIAISNPNIISTVGPSWRHFDFSPSVPYKPGDILYVGYFGPNTEPAALISHHYPHSPITTGRRSGFRSTIPQTIGGSMIDAYKWGWNLEVIEGPELLTKQSAKVLKEQEWSEIFSFENYSEVNQDASANITAVFPYEYSKPSAIGQTFQAPNYKVKLTKATFYLRKVNSPTGTLRARLYNMTGIFGNTGVPTGNPLATSETFNTSSVPTAWTLIDFTFSVPYELIPNAYYCILVYAASGVYDPIGYIQVGQDSIDEFHPGNAFDYNSGDWNFHNYKDTCFYLNGAKKIGWSFSESLIFSYHKELIEALPIVGILYQKVKKFLDEKRRYELEEEQILEG